MNAHGGGPIGNVSISTTSTEIVPVDKHRRYLIMRNIGSDTVYLSIGVPAEAGKGIPVFPLEYYEILGDNMTEMFINGICSPGDSTTLTYQVGR